MCTVCVARWCFDNPDPNFVSLFLAVVNQPKPFLLATSAKLNNTLQGAYVCFQLEVWEQLELTSLILPISKHQICFTLPEKQQHKEKIYTYETIYLMIIFIRILQKFLTNLICLLCQNQWHVEASSTLAHCVLLKHYYSVDFPWWFDRKLVSLVSSAKLGNWKEKSCQMTEIQNCTLWFDRKTVSVEFCQLAVLDWDFISIWKPNPCMDPLEKKILLYQFLF